MITSYSETWGYGDALPSLPYNISPGVYADVCKAISERRKIKITYTDSHGYRSSRIVRAEKLGKYGTKWFLIGHCELRHDSRNFNLQKITSTNLLEQYEANNPVSPKRVSTFSETHAYVNRHKYSENSIPNVSFSQRSYRSADGRYVGLFISYDVYMALERKLFALSETQKKQFFFIYGVKYGENAKQYAENTFYNWKHGLTKLSGATKDGVLQTVPKVLSAEERFELFEKIIEDNEAKQKKTANHFFECSISEWQTERKKIETAIYNATVSYIDSLDYAQKYDLTQIEWIADKDIETFKQWLEIAKKQAFSNKLSRLSSDLNVFESKWSKIDLSNPEEKKVEIEFQYNIPTDDFRIVIYNKIYRDAKKRNELINNWAGCLLPVLILITLFCLMKGCSK